MGESQIVLSHAVSVLRCALDTQSSAPLRMMTKRAIETLEALKPAEPDPRAYKSWGDELMSLKVLPPMQSPEMEGSKNATGQL